MQVQLYDFDQVCEQLRCDEPSLLALLKSGAVPRPILIGDRLVRWPQNTFNGWILNGCKAGERPIPEMFAAIRETIVIERMGRKSNEQRRRADVIRKRPSPDVSGKRAIPQPSPVVTGGGDVEYLSKG